MSTDLEPRLAQALGDDAVPSHTLAALIAETEQAIVAADETAEAERIKALDPALSPDPAAARKAMEDAAFIRDRLRTLLPRLHQKHRQVVDQERYDAWCKTFDPLKPRHAAAVEQLRSVYEEFAPKMVAALREAAAVDGEVAAVMHHKHHVLNRSNNDGRYLATVELAARGLNHVAHGFSLMTDFKLPLLSEPNQLAWPPSLWAPGVQMVGNMTPEQVKQYEQSFRVPSPCIGDARNNI